jgi:hypothetical protein
MTGLRSRLYGTFEERTLKVETWSWQTTMVRSVPLGVEPGDFLVVRRPKYPVGLPFPVHLVPHGRAI